ncbi:MAG: site-specific integrase, partial [Candidatus Margulisbacteria bacterium]|nr:site-specific integrase [Candidatus Margulisiibacteriota bacterium]
VKYNPVKNVLHFSGVPTKKRGALSAEEIEKIFPENHDQLMSLWKSQLYLTAFLVLKDTGLRPGELRALQWKDWDRDLRFFPITKAIEANTRVKIKSTKTGICKPAIVSEFTAQEIDRLKNSKPAALPEDFIFAHETGKPVSDSILSFHFKEGLRGAGINRTDVTPYWLRHTFNTRMLETLPDKAVRVLMGHRTVAMTQYYRDATVASLKREAQKIINMLDVTSNISVAAAA